MPPARVTHAATVLFSFDGDELDPGLWLPRYLPHWSTRTASAARYRLGDGHLRLLVEGLGKGLQGRGTDLRDVLMRLEPLHRDHAKVRGSLAQALRLFVLGGVVPALRGFEVGELEDDEPVEAEPADAEEPAGDREGSREATWASSWRSRRSRSCRST